jgi:hypothetical protein
MSMFEVPKMSTHSLDKYRNANIDFITASRITGSAVISGASYQGPLVTSIVSSGAAVTGQITITTGAGLNITQTGNTIVIYLA